ncbi:hypothetical protein Nepgr_014040 [Nepenthes gracilis]|uniref:CCHC-type domain-containing protein n=1 Tax=Nepenthes gracilis TaxID=150966 RepID=A0AAD3SK59_NEPGR|nr:hypothetical protein Nepgr_014040 [Nepenthes gracilis]
MRRRREKDSIAKTKSGFSDEDPESLSNPTFVFSDSEDEEANEDLSLKIVEKAMSRAIDASQKHDDVIAVKNLTFSTREDIVTTELVTSAIKKKKVKRAKKKAINKIEAEVESVNAVKETDNVDTIKAVGVVNLSEPGTVENADNVVLRRLLRGPRYFDPPDSSWGTCYNCGEDGHITANCISARRKKPCFICGSFEHEGKQCTKGKDCFICNEGGHRAKHCPKKFQQCSKGSELCLKCGAFGHAMPLCRNDYSPDDLKEIRCYVCKRFGHLCCANYFNTTRDASCYKCGQSGHTGLECSRGELSEAATPSSCFKCGEEGHFARECTKTKFSKVKRRSVNSSTPDRKSSKDGDDQRAIKSATRDVRKAQKRKKMQFDGGDRTGPGKSNWRGGWITDDPGDLPRRIDQGNRWRSPATPVKNHRISSLSTRGGYRSNSRYSRKSSWSYPEPLNLQVSAVGIQHRFSRPRFFNSSSDGIRRNYDWW